MRTVMRVVVALVVWAFVIGVGEGAGGVAGALIQLGGTGWMLWFVARAVAGYDDPPPPEPTRPGWMPAGPEDGAGGGPAGRRDRGR